MRLYKTPVLVLVAWMLPFLTLHSQDLPGNWSSAVSYSAGDKVILSTTGVTYVALKSSTGVSPDQDSSSWISLDDQAADLPTDLTPPSDEPTSTTPPDDPIPSTPGSDSDSSTSTSIVQMALSTTGYITPSAYMSAGFVIQGGSMKVIIMGKGANGVSDSLNNPRLDILSQATGWTSIATNTDWKSGTQVTDITATGLMSAYKDTDSALILTLDPGTYIARVYSESGDSGAALAEIYDLDTVDGKSTGAYLSGISTSGTVLSGTSRGQRMSGGFHITGTGSLKLIIMAKGSSSGGNQALGNPRLDVRSGNASWASIGSNSDWKSGTQVTEITATNLMSAYKDTDAALILTLTPGVYIADVYSETSASGRALVELYLIE